MNNTQILSVGLCITLASCGGDGNSSPPSSSSLTSSSSANAQSSLASTSSDPVTSSSQASSQSSQAANPACIEAALDSGYCLVWRDEFNSTSVDTTKWRYEKNCWGGGNNEAQCYVESAENVWQDGEYLFIKAVREDTVGPATHDDQDNYDPDDISGNGTYTSGRLRSKYLGDWRYGRFEIRAKLPHGQGTWPAVWMLPTDWEYGGWARSGEIDIMEAVNLGVGGEDRVHGTLHFGDNWPNNVYAGAEYHLPNGGTAFHTYTVEWEEGEIRWYVDDNHYATQTSAGWYSTAALDEPNAPFNQRFHLLLNLAVGGNWAGAVNDTGIDESAFPQQMEIDYVRVYQCTHDSETGIGCASRGNDFTLIPGITPPGE